MRSASTRIRTAASTVASSSPTETCANSSAISPPRRNAITTRRGATSRSALFAERLVAPRRVVIAFLRGGEIALEFAHVSVGDELATVDAAVRIRVDALRIVGERCGAARVEIAQQLERSLQTRR